MASESTTSLALQPQETDLAENAAINEFIVFPGGKPSLMERSLAWTPFPATAGDAQSQSEFFQSIRPHLDAGLEIVPAEGNRSAVYQAAKRLFDIVGAIVLLICLSPIMLVTFFVLMFTTGGKPLFRQTRLGHPDI